MTSTLKKKYLVILGMLLLVSTHATAEEDSDDSNPSTCCETNCCDTQNFGFCVYGECLYWLPELAGLEGAFGDTSVASTTDGTIVTTTIRESDKQPHFKWNPGFRVGAEAELNCFDLDLYWTHYDGRAKFSEDEQHGHWRIRYDTIDLTFGRYFCVVPCFYLKPFIGVRGTQIHQKLKSHLETIFTTLTAETSVATDKDDKENFWGIGPQLGVCADWYLGYNLSLYGSFAVVTYYGDVNRKNFDTDTFTRTVSVVRSNSKHCFNNIGTDAALGIRWDTTRCFCCCEMDLMLQLGVEQHRIYDFSNLGNDGTLSLDGGVFAAGVGFRY